MIVKTSEQRWAALLCLFLARLGMGYQYQTVASAASDMQRVLGVGVDVIGLLIGIYFIAGVFITLPAPAMAVRFGEKRCVAIALGLMLLGSVLSASGVESESVQFVARILSGFGGVIMNLLVTKMVADRFAGRELATAMAILVSSWPAGIALALIVVPVISSAAGLVGVFASSLVPLLGGLFLFLALYPSDTPRPSEFPLSKVAWPDGHSLTLVILAGSVWAFFNAALAIVFSFAPLMLIEKGLSKQAAGAETSLVLWFSIASIPIGGILADRTKRPALVIWAGTAVATALMLLVTVVPNGLTFTLLGLVFGLPAGPVVALPATVLPPHVRTTGMAVFYLVFYVIMISAPVTAGLIGRAFGSADAAFLTSAGAMVAGMAGFLLFQMSARQSRRAVVV